jgi:hypothetical protein
MTNIIWTVTGILLGRNIEPYVIMDECASRGWCLHVVHGMNITEWFRVNYSI